MKRILKPLMSTIRNWIPNMHGAQYVPRKKFLNKDCSLVAMCKSRENSNLCVRLFPD